MKSPAPVSWVGRTLKNTYRIDQLIGEGGTGLVFRGLHLRLKVPIAVKVLKQNAGEVAYARFRKEAEITARLRHPNIVNVLDYDVTDDAHAYLVTEWLEGETLAAYMKARGAVPAETAVSLLRQVCDAVSAAHAAGVVHRDLKPANLFLCRAVGQGEPLVKVLDFGIAKLTELDPVRTEQGQTVGTPRYMSPEQIKTEGEDELGPGSDQFSLGSIAYELVAGRPAYPGSAHAAMLAVLEGRPAPLPGTLPAGYRAAVARAMALRPEERFPSLGEFCAALQRSLLEPPLPAFWALPWARGAVFGAAALCGAGLALLVLFSGMRSPRPAPVSAPPDTLPRLQQGGVVNVPLTVSGLDEGRGRAAVQGTPPGTSQGPKERDSATADGDPVPEGSVVLRPRGLPEGAQLYVDGRPASPRRLVLQRGTPVRLRAVPPAKTCLKPGEMTYTPDRAHPPAFHLPRDRDCPYF